MAPIWCCRSSSVHLLQLTPAFIPDCPVWAQVVQVWKLLGAAPVIFEILLRARLQALVRNATGTKTQ